MSDEDTGRFWVPLIVAIPALIASTVLAYSDLPVLPYVLSLFGVLVVIMTVCSYERDRGLVE